MTEHQVVVLSSDATLRREVEAVVASSGAVQTIFAEWQSADEMRPIRGDRIVVIDDEGQVEAVALVQSMKAREGSTAIIYLAAHHSIELEREVRRAGVSYYADKSARGRNWMLAIEAILRTKEL